MKIQFWQARAGVKVGALVDWPLVPRLNEEVHVGRPGDFAIRGSVAIVVWVFLNGELVVEVTLFASSAQ